MTLNSVVTTLVMNTDKGGELIDILSINPGQALLITAVGGTITVYSLSSTDPKINDLVKTQLKNRIIL